MRVLGNRAHRLAETRALEKKVHAERKRHGHRPRSGARLGDDELADDERALPHRHRLVVGAEDQKPEVDQQDGDAVGGEQRGEQGPADDALDEDRLQPVAEEKRRRHDERERDDGVETEGSEQHPSGEGADEHEVGVRDVDDAHHAEDEVEAAGEQRVERAREQPADQELAENDGVEEFLHKEPIADSQ